MNTLFTGNKTIQDIVHEYSDMLLRIAFQNTNQMSEAEDIVQEVYIKLIKTKNDFDCGEHLKAWLIKATINRCKDFFKSAWFKKVVPLTESMDFFAPEEKTMMEEIFKLNKDDRNIIYLYHYEGYKINEIAKILDKSENTIRSKLQRARKKLKTILLEEGSFVQ